MLVFSLIFPQGSSWRQSSPHGPSPTPFYFGLISSFCVFPSRAGFNGSAIQRLISLHSRESKTLHQLQNPIISLHFPQDSPLLSIRRSSHQLQYLTKRLCKEQQEQESEPKHTAKKPFLGPRNSRTAPAMEKEREHLVYLARLAEQAERYDGAFHQTHFFFLLFIEF